MKKRNQVRNRSYKACSQTTYTHKRGTIPKPHSYLVVTLAFLVRQSEARAHTPDDDPLPNPSKARPHVVQPLLSAAPPHSTDPAAPAMLNPLPAIQICPFPFKVQPASQSSVYLVHLGCVFASSAPPDAPGGQRNVPAVSTVPWA